MLKLKALFTKYYQQLTSNEKYLFQYILDRPQEIANMSISDLSESIHISTSSISRFCQKIGFDGYSEFRYFLSNNENEEKHAQISDPDYIFEDFYSTKKLFNQADSRKLISWLEEANIIFCYGTGMGQRLVIKDFIRKMLPLKKIVIEIEAPTELSYYSHNSNAQDILMIFSLSGNVDNIVSQVALFKQKQVRIVGVSQLGQSVLSDLSDFNLYYQSQVFAIEMDTYVSFLRIHYLTDLIILAYKNQSDNEELS